MSRHRPMTRSRGISRKTALKRGKPPECNTPMRQRNAKRKARLDAEACGPHAVYVRTHPCRICGHMPVDAHHEKSRGAGGKAQHLVPLCRSHHIVRHSDGKRTFARKHSIDLDNIAAEFWEDSPANPANAPILQATEETWTK